MAGRPRKPTAVLEATGAFDKNPDRRRAREGEPAFNGPIGQPPKYFDADKRAIWQELVDEAAPGVLAKSDRSILELTVALKAKARAVPSKMPRWLTEMGRALEEFGTSEDVIEEMKHHLRAQLGMTAQEQSLLKECLVQLGMTPASKSKVHGEQPAEKKVDPFDAAFAELRGGKQPVQ